MEIKVSEEKRNRLSQLSNVSIFSQPWWLDAVAPGRWDAVIAEKGGQIAAIIPYVIRKRFHFTIITMPPLTQALGPWLRPSTAKYANVLAEQKDLMTHLIEGLPRFDYFWQNFHYSITNWLPFYWQGFQQTTRYTYVLEELRDLDKIWSGTLSNIRTDIKKARNRYNLIVRTDLGIDTFLDINELTFKRQRMSLPYSRDFVKRIDAACLAHNARKIFFAQDGDGKIHASVYIVWDENSAYNLMLGADPKLRMSGAASLLMWEAIQFAAGVTERFDFEGSMIEPVERFFRAFGAKQKPYFQLSKNNLSLLSAALTIKFVKNMLRRASDFLVE